MTSSHLILAIIVFFASVLSGMSGGAGSLISIPAAIYLGFPPVQVLSSIKFGGLGISLGSFLRFRKEPNLIDKKIALSLSVFAAISALTGSLLLVKFQSNSDAIEKLVGLTILIVIPFIVFKKKLKQESPQAKISNFKKIIGYTLMSVLITLQSAMGSGVGFLQYLTLSNLMGLRPTVAIATRRAMQLIVASVALIVYIASGVIDYKLGAILFVSTLFGGYIGSHIAVKKGDDFIEKAIVVISLIMAISLILR